MNPALLGFLRGLGVVVLGAGLTYLGDAAHLAFLSPQVAALIAMLALGAEHLIESSTGNALFGAVKTR